MKIQSRLGSLRVGDGCPVRLMGVINVSPESFYKGSVASSESQILKTLEQMEDDGADIIDIGAMSTAPYLETHLPEVEESKRLSWAVSLIRRRTKLTISVDTGRRGPAQAGLDAGADCLNDVTGLQMDPALAPLAAQFKGIILMANPLNALRHSLRDPIHATRRLLREALDRLPRSVPRSRVIVDPGIGFFRKAPLSWVRWDLEILKNLGSLRSLGYPILVGVSRKSFIGKISDGIPPELRLEGSLAATAAAVLNGSSIVRTHDVKATRRCVRVAEAIKAGKSWKEHK